MTDHAELLHVIDVLNNTPDENFEAVFPTIWNVDDWMPTLAALQTIGYADTPVNGNNFYTYYPAPGEPTQFALWDLDGGYWWDLAPCEQPADVIGWDLFKIAKCHSNVPLFQRVVAVEAWRTRFLEGSRDFLLGPFDPDRFSDRVAEVVTLIGPALSEDSNRKGDDAQFAAEVAELVDLQSQRAENVRAQLEALGIL